MGKSLRAAVAAAGMLALSAVPAGAEPLQAYEGAIHEHTAYSDGEPGKRPADAFAAVKARGSSFMVSTEHSDTQYVPVVTNTKCLSLTMLLKCIGGDATQPLDALRKWQATREQTDAATSSSFVGIRGFEWTNDRHGHLNVLFSTHTTNAKLDGGYLTMDAFWSWLQRPVALGGGADGLGIFNHPSSREVGDLVPGGFLGFLPSIPLPGAMWDDLRYVPGADSRMIGMELFNGGGDYGKASSVHPAGPFGRALDRGWHVGAVGAEDTHDTSWGAPSDRKTVILATALTRSALRDALERRRFYAVHHAGVRMTFTVDGEQMGSRLSRAHGTPVTFEATGPAGSTLELVTSGGVQVASAAGALAVQRPASPAERWYFVRVRDAEGRAIAYSSPIWVNG